MNRILAGIETEYGLFVEGRGAEDQIDDAMALVRSYPDECLVAWDYRYESPRADLRGFKLDRLQADPEDARFDRGRARLSDSEVRSDRILANGARLYNDHGHPEYATPECWSTAELAVADRQGEAEVLRAAMAFEAASGRQVRVYKNNTDFHGASYGTHESYLVPRSLPFEALYAAVTPILVARTLLCGAGKVGSEAGAPCRYQKSQRADFLVEAVNAETLYRRPVFNTRDEPHAPAGDWVRLHVISGDANRIQGATARKVGLVKLALLLALAGECPTWNLKDPAASLAAISRGEDEFPIALASGWVDARRVIDSYLDRAESVFGLHGVRDPASESGEAAALILECRQLIADLSDCPERFASKVDWAAKRGMLEQVIEAEGLGWDHPSLRSYDLEYHNIDPDVGLFDALVDMGSIAEPTEAPKFESRSRAWARGLAVSRFRGQLVTACWRSLTFELDGKRIEVELLPDRTYPQHLEEASDVVEFIEMLRGAQ